MEELPEPRPTYILARGAYDAPKTDTNRVERDTFENILIPFPADAPRNRLGLAKWLTDSNHPLTARVFVNRMWANFFGAAIGDDAGEFRPARHDADASGAARLACLAILSTMVGTSSGCAGRLCYRRRISRTRGAARSCGERDPENLLLARGPSHRLSAEQIRDLALAASGLLERQARRAARVALPAGRRSCGGRRTLCRRRISSRPERICIAGRCTRCGSGRRRCRTCWRSMRRRAKYARWPAAARIRRCRRWCS